jgi:hypothetical protein
MPNPPKSNRKILGIQLPLRLRREPSPRPRAGPPSNQTRDTELNQSPQPQNSNEATSKPLGSVQNSGSSAEVSNENPPQTAEPALKVTIQNTQPAPTPSSSLQSTDLQNTKTRYVEAYDALREAITKDNSLSAVFNELSADPEGIDDSFIKKLHGALESQNTKVKDRSAWGTCKNTVKYLAHTFKPFAKNFLAIAVHASAVYYLPALSDIVDSNSEPIWINM